ncbi:MAG: sigma-70 family RNA polymerase sigma factor [Polyangiaceae bacterium]
MKDATLTPFSPLLSAAGVLSGGRETGPVARAVEERPALDFGEVFREHGEFVLRTVRRMGVPAAEVEDIAQNVFLVVHRHLGSYEGRGSVKAWLFGIVRRAVADQRRQRRRRPEVPVMEPPDEGVEPTTEAELDRARERVLLDRALDSLDEAKREVFVLFELEQMSMAEVAAAVGCPLQTAYSRLYAARERVKESVLAAARARGGHRGNAA